VVTLDQIAHGQAIRAGVPEMAAHLQALFGQKLTAVLLGITEPKAVGRYARGEQKPQAEIEERLRAAFQIATLLEQAESAAIVRAWFMGMNPELDDQAPARVLRREPERVLQAARQFLAGG
jgi:hypothetical protein